MSGGLLGVALRRIGVALPLIFLVSVLVFVVLRLIPSDPISMSVPPNATKEEIEALRRELGLHLPIYEQFGIWFGKLISGDLGKSIAFSQPVALLIGQSLPATIELVVLAAIFATVIGLAGGLVMYRLNGRPGETAADLASTLVMSIPEFLWAIFFILLVGVAFNVLPFAGRLDSGITVDRITGFLLQDSLIEGRF
ncbi:MAG: ABC transporter permease, partial [Alphaproteobacteria bacterium]